MLTGQRLVIEEATITMEGSFVPVLGVLATSDVDDYTINVEIFGPAANPEFKFSSEPELPEEEVLSRLLFGSGLDTLSPFKAARLVNATRILTGQGGVDLASDIRSGTGLADLDVNTDDQGNTEVTAGAYLSEDVYTDVTVGSSGDTKINLNFDVTDTVTLQSSASNRGETSIGIIFQRDY